MSSILKKKIDKRILWAILIIAALLFFFYPKACKQLLYNSSMLKSQCKCVGYEKEEARTGVRDILGFYNISVCYGIPITGEPMTQTTIF